MAGGRPKGSPNKVTKEIRSIAQKHGPVVVRELVRLATKAESEAARVAAAKELLDRAYGKSTQPVEHSGPQGGPIPCTWLTQEEAKKLGWA